jgi:hypothetical protein
MMAIDSVAPDRTLTIAMRGRLVGLSQRPWRAFLVKGAQTQFHHAVAT